MLIKTLMDTSEDRGGDVVSKKKIKDLRISIDPSSDLEDTITAATLSKVIEIIAR